MGCNWEWAGPAARMSKEVAGWREITVYKNGWLLGNWEILANASKAAFRKSWMDNGTSTWFLPVSRRSQKPYIRKISDDGYVDMSKNPHYKRSIPASNWVSSAVWSSVSSRRFDTTRDLALWSAETERDCRIRNERISRNEGKISHRYDFNRVCTLFFAYYKHKRGNMCWMAFLTS